MLLQVLPQVLTCHTVREFAKRGACLGLLARGTDGLEATHHEVKKLGGKAVVCPVYVASFEQVNQAAAKIENELGSITIWINNAMVSVFSPRVRVTMVHLPALNTPQFGW